jgi:hypothetical protein
MCCGTGIARIQEVEGTRQGVQEAVGDAPGVAAFPEDDALHPEVERGLADAQRDLLHVLGGTDEQAEVRGLGRMRG